jgi:hypothetical protein
MQHPNAFPEALSLFAIILFLKLVVMGLWNPFMGDGQGRIWLYLAPYIMHGDANRVLVTPHRTQDTGHRTQFPTASWTGTELSKLHWSQNMALLNQGPHRRSSDLLADSKSHSHMFVA